MIVVTGATGSVGGAVARELAARGVPFRMLVRDAARAPDLPGADVAVGAYEDADALARALEPGDRVFMVSMHASFERRLALHRAFLEVAARRRVGRVAYLSFVGAGPEATFTHARSHGETEALLRDSGLTWVAVRNAMYADEIGDWFDPDGRITGPGGDGRISLTSRRELGEAIAALLADPARDDREVVTITTPDAVGLAELAARAAEVSGRDLRYEPLSREEWVAYRRALGRQDWSVQGGLAFYDGIAKGEADVVGDDYRRLTGRAPAPIRTLLETFREDILRGVQPGGAAGATHGDEG